MRHGAFAVLCTLLASVACSSASNMSGERRNIGSVTMTFTVVPSKAKPGQSVRLTIRLVNNAGTSTELAFPTSQKYDFWVTEGRTELWRWSAGRMFTQEVNRQEIGGQTGAVFAESWPASKTGKLTAHAELKARTYGGEMKGTLVVG
jgi:hypothetical protein